MDNFCKIKDYTETEIFDNLDNDSFYDEII
jgi:hypothetical protein